MAMMMMNKDCRLQLSLSTRMSREETFPDTESAWDKFKSQLCRCSAALAVEVWYGAVGCSSCATFYQRTLVLRCQLRQWLNFSVLPRRLIRNNLLVTSFGVLQAASRSLIPILIFKQNLNSSPAQFLNVIVIDGFIIYSPKRLRTGKNEFTIDSH